MWMPCLLSPHPHPGSTAVYMAVPGFLAQVLGFEFGSLCLPASVLITKQPLQLRPTLTLLNPALILNFEEKMRSVPWDFLTTKHNC